MTETIAYAKINLALSVTGKRPDGYHTLKTIMQSISLSDIVRISLNQSTNIAVTCSDGNIPVGMDNIAYKAAVAFSEFTGKRFGADIFIEKQIPSQAGLGGGSADAAAVIATLNKLCGTELSQSQLCEIGVKVGADVPFCIIGGTCLCEGIGEIITPLPSIQGCFIVIGKGSLGISTRDAFERIDKMNLSDCFDLHTDDFIGDISSISTKCFNIFEHVSNVSEIEIIRRIMLTSGALCAVMSGSGSALYAVFTDKAMAEGCLSALKNNNFFGAVCKPVNCGTE